MMPKILHKACSLQHFFIAVLLLGVLVLHAEKALAAGINTGNRFEIKTGGTAATSKTILKKKTSSESFSPFAALKQNFSKEATVLHVNFTLQQGLITVLIKSFDIPINEAIPVYAIISPGISFVAQIVPITILPNAP